MQTKEADAARLQAEAKERHAAANYARIRDLYETRSASRTELDAARANAESAKAVLEASEKKLELALNQLDYTKLRAPLDGSIASIKTACV